MRAFVSSGEGDLDLPIMQQIKERKKERFRFPVALHIDSVGYRMPLSYLTGVGTVYE